MEDLTPDIPTEALEAAAQAVADRFGTHYDVRDMRRPAIMDHHRDAARDILAAAAPHLIAEGRKQAAEAIRAEGPRVTEVKFWFVQGEERYESGAEWAARIAEGTNPREETTP